MEILYFATLLVSVAGNVFTLYKLWGLLKEKVSPPEQIYNKMKDGLLPFVEPMKETDQHDLSEVDDEVLKKAIKKTINKIPELDDDEEKTAQAKEFLI